MNLDDFAHSINSEIWHRLSAGATAETVFDAAALNELPDVVDFNSTEIDLSVEPPIATHRGLSSRCEVGIDASNSAALAIWLLATAFSTGVAGGVKRLLRNDYQPAEAHTRREITSTSRLRGIVTNNRGLPPDRQPWIPESYKWVPHDVSVAVEIAAQNSGDGLDIRTSYHEDPLLEIDGDFDSLVSLAAVFFAFSFDRDCNYVKLTGPYGGPLDRKDNHSIQCGIQRREEAATTVT